MISTRNPPPKLKKEEPFLKKGKRVKKLAHPSNLLLRDSNPLLIESWRPFLQANFSNPVPIGQTGTVVETNQVFVAVRWDHIEFDDGIGRYLQSDAMVILQPID